MEGLIAEYKQAIKELETRRMIYSMAGERYEKIAYHEMKAAEERVEALVKDLKEGGVGDKMPKM